MDDRIVKLGARKSSYLLFVYPQALPILRGAVRFFEGYLLQAPVPTFAADSATSSSASSSSSSGTGSDSSSFVERMVKERTSRDATYPSLLKHRTRAQSTATTAKVLSAEKAPSDGSDRSSTGLWNWATNKVGHQLPSGPSHDGINGDSGIEYPNVVLLSGPATSPENSYTDRVALGPKATATAQAAINKMADKVMTHVCLMHTSVFVHMKLLINILFCYSLF